MSSVLVLDDRPADRELLATLLRHVGHSVRAASTGDEALELAHAEPPDLIIADIPMSTMSGYDFVRRLRSERDIGATPIIFCTANYFEDEVRGLAETSGVSHFIPKPADPAAIVGTVGELLGRDVDRDPLRVLNEKLVERVNELETANVERKRLVAELLRAHEEERQRIAEDLHDDSIQAVIALGTRLDTLARSLPDPAIAGELDVLKEQALLAADRLRHLLSELQPVELDRQGLRVALEVYLERAREEDGLAYEIDDRTTHRLTKPARRLLYRTAREALANVRTHAEASCVQVLLEEQNGDVRVTVRDDGKGFSPEEWMGVRPGHLGLPSMRERVETAGGFLRIDSRPGAGSTVEIRIPEPAA